MSVFTKFVLLLCMLTLAWAKRTTVEITNSLEGKENLNIHCKSKDDDLGFHLLPINQSFQWSFRPHFLGKTLFFCSFQWGNDPLLHFDAYDEPRDIDLCSNCHWYIKKDGPCRYEEPTYRKCYKWN
ncbi:S-protein-like protein [Vigna angularis]|uniref:S-protein homolog n=1 Tax=Phaseolus angularis TaxID=3914 RepID=A0A8T0KVH1_PHAAN|nr:S-protein-like protein [Vigna angularis]